jgi:hemerythrin-like metal-binding protein
LRFFTASRILTPGDSVMIYRGDTREQREHMKSAINEEHALLRQKLSAVFELCPHARDRSDCARCTRHSPNHCSSVMTDIEEDLMSYMVAHFHHEERLMRDTGLYYSARDLCEQHMQDHGDLSDTALQLLTKLHDGTLPVQIAGMSSLLEQWLENHIAQHDQTLLKLLGEA